MEEIQSSNRKKKNKKGCLPRIFYHSKTIFQKRKQNKDLLRKTKTDLLKEMIANGDLVDADKAFDKI